MTIKLINLPEFLEKTAYKTFTDESKKIINKYQYKIKYTIRNYYVISGVTPTNYEGCIPNRAGLIKTWNLYRNTNIKWKSYPLPNKFKGRKRKVIVYVESVEYAQYLIKMKGGKYNFLKFVIPAK